MLIRMRLWVFLPILALAVTLPLGAGSDGDDRLVGDRGADVFRGGDGADLLRGRQGDDRLRGGAHNDKLRGGKGNDRLVGGAGDDRLYGGPGRDVLYGGVGDDWLYGGKNRDRLVGGVGDDRLSGGPGRDSLTGGPGRDRFLLLHPATEAGDADRIRDFDPRHDRLILRDSQAALWVEQQNVGKRANTFLYGDAERGRTLAVLVGGVDLAAADAGTVATESGAAVTDIREPAMRADFSPASLMRQLSEGVAVADLVGQGAPAANLFEANLGIEDLRGAGVPAVEIHEGLQEVARVHAPVCVLSATAEMTECTIALPEVVYDDSVYPTDMADQSDNYLVKIDSSRAFAVGDRLTYAITDGNPSVAVAAWSQTIYKVPATTLEGYRISDDGKLYPKDVYALSRNREQLESEGGLVFLGHRRRLAFQQPDRTVSPPQFGSGVMYYPAEYTYLKTETDTLTIEVRHARTGVTKTVRLNVLPNHRAHPVPVDLFAEHSERAQREREIKPASSRGVACFSAAGEQVADCVTHLPRVAYRHTPLSLGSFPDQADKYLMRVDASRAFGEGANLDYEIIAGNPRILFPYYRPRFQRTFFYDLVGYQIDRQGRIYFQDSWLFGRNNDIYKHDLDALWRYVRANGSGRAYSQGNLCPRTRGVKNDSACVDEFFCRAMHGTADQDCSGLFFHPLNYTFGRTDTDRLRVRVTDKDSGVVRDIVVTIQPHPRAVASVAECAHETDPMDKWGCINSQALLPEREFETTDAMRNSLPDDLAFPKSEYHLVNAIEFDSFEEMATMTWLPESFRKNPNVEIKDGKLILHLYPAPVPEGEEGGGPGKCRFVSHGSWPRLSGRGVFEPADGYLEYKFSGYSYQVGHGGNIIHWSRYGVDHHAFRYQPPHRILAYSNDVTVEDVTPMPRGIISSASVSKVGYLEIDFLERWTKGMTRPWFVAHTYPVRRTNLVLMEKLQLRQENGDPHYPFVYQHPIRPPTAYFRPGHLSRTTRILPSGTNNGDGTYAITYGMEILTEAAAKQSAKSDSDAIRIFIDGKRKAITQRVPNQFMNGNAAWLLEVFPGSLDSNVGSCSRLKKTRFELDHVRFYRRRPPPSAEG